MKILGRLLGALRPRPRAASLDDMDISQREEALESWPLKKSLDENINNVSTYMGSPPDLVIRRFEAGPDRIKGTLLFMDGMADKPAVQSILKSIEIETLKTAPGPLGKSKFYDTVRKRLLVNHEVDETTDLSGLFDQVAGGGTVVLVDGTAQAICCDTRGWETRTIIEPDAETTIRGPREGFVESIRVNTSLIRRRIRTPNLWIERFTIGSLTRTEVNIAYIKGLVGEEFLGEIRDRIEKIDIDGILESGYIEDLITDASFTLIPTILRTERPDRVSGCLLEGQIAILTDGTPFALIMPATFGAFLQAPDDYYEIFPIGTLIRSLRMLALLLAVFLPGIYVAVVNYHQELLPTDLLLRIAASREGVPFPVAFEMFLFDALFEILREAGIRLPRAIGPAISIVGALVLGQAAIQAGLVSPVVVIVVALTAIASFTAPAFSIGIAARIVRFLILIMGAVFGLFGIQFATLLILVHLSSIRSLGVPFLAPWAPFIMEDMKDSGIRFFWWGLGTRPRLTGFREPRRMAPGQRPAVRKHPRKEGGG